ncbi:ATP-binding protein [Leptolyngbya sp. PCC 6406]|uniref:ATP-binding protein n=1 Tax=Leptolyngbya sp. PCC 6406 TaxID=1173264 RepID=UPI0021F248BD|nr:ATP-binding protein [Leptolyngbya sp. PCC 6406]
MLSVVIAEERQLGHTKLAEQLDAILQKNTRLAKTEQFALAPQSLTASIAPVGPHSSSTAAQPLKVLSSNRRFNHPFVLTVPRDRLRHHMVLSDAVEERFCRIEREYAARDRLAHYGLKYRQKILLYGSPGCGKTMGAERIAWNTGLPLVKVRFDAMVSSYLGETATNLREVFETAAANPCLLFIDECDALAKSREDAQEVGEIKRVVNTFLQLLDEYEVSNGLLIAATNLTKFLDEAVWRRFDDVIEVPKPTEPEIRTILKQTLVSVEVGSVDWDATVQKLDGFSAAQIVRIAQNAAKRAILDREDLVIQEHLEASIQDVIVAHAG